ncbi:MAG: hypothetical protein WB711_24435 [Terriglobales bacterium]
MKRIVFGAFLILTAVAILPGLGRWAAAPSEVVLASDDTHPPTTPVPRTFFGMHRHAYPNKHEPWPDIPFGSFRMWDSATGWAQINTANGKYDWSQVDRWFSELKEHDVDDILYTFGRVPEFASSQPNLDCNNGPGQCAPPKDLKSDGTGSDQYWKDFVTAIVTHSKNNRGIHIKYWELWNEPYLPRYWSGTFPQLLRMARDAKEIIHSIDPDAVFLSPDSGLVYPKYRQFMEDWLAAGGGEYADGIAFHGYTQRGPATDFIQYYREFRKILAKYHQDTKPTYDTEASWGNVKKGKGYADEDSQAAFVAQFYLVHWSEGVQRLYWYAWNDGATGMLYDRESKRSTQGARAYREVFNWMVGSTMTRGCSPDGSVWTCTLTKADGKEALVVWNESGEKNYSPKGAFKKFRDVAGNSNPISGPLKIGPKPLFLESQ